MVLYPVMLNIASRRAVVIGGGKVALRKVDDLVRCGARVTVVAPDIHESITALHDAVPESVELVRRPYRRGDLDGAHIVFAAAGDAGVNREVFIEASEKNIFINAVDDPPNCTFFVPSWFDRNGLIISVSTSGISPSLAAKIRRNIEQTLPDSIDDMLASLQRAREVLRVDEEFRDLTSDQRGLVLKRIVDDDALLEELVRSYREDSVKSVINKIRRAL